MPTDETVDATEEVVTIHNTDRTGLVYLASKISAVLHLVGENPDREGLLETPMRSAKAWKFLTSGYDQDPATVMKQFDADGYRQLVLLKDVEVFSLCVAGSTFVETPHGRIPISRLQNGEWIYTLNEETGFFEVERCKRPRITRQNANLVRIYCDKDTLLCTPDHMILTYDHGWSEAQYILPGTRVAALNKGAMYHGNALRPYVMQGLGETNSVPEHRVIAESIYGKLTNRDHVHHLDERPYNNDPSNLRILGREEHISKHAQSDGRGKRESKRWADFTPTEKAEFERKRKAGLAAAHADPVRREAMLAKRSASVTESWKKRKQGGNHRVIAVEHVPWTEDVWCLTAPKNKNFVANGIVVHNCEHHLLPFFGRAHVAYIPNGKVLGVSKLARVVDIFARRLQIQERIGEQVTASLMEHLQPTGAACIIEASHLCMQMRGVEKQHSKMVTSSLKGVFLEDSQRGMAAREELMQLVFRK